MPQLYVVRGRDRGRVFWLDAPRLTVGRDSGNAIRLDDTEVSRRHAVLELVSEGYCLADLASSNGTFCNGQRVDRRLLHSGDRVQLGKTQLLFRDHAQATTVAVDAEVDVVTAGSQLDLSEIVHTARPQLTGDDWTVAGPLSASPVEVAPALSGDNAGPSGQGRVRPSAPEEPPADAGRTLVGDLPVGDLPVGDLERVASTSDRRGEGPPDRSAADGDRYWQLMYATAQLVSRTLDIESLLDQILEHIFRSVACDRGCILLVNDQTGDLQPVATRQRVSGTARLQISRTMVDYVLQRREGILTSNASEDSRWEQAQSIVDFRVREAICVPMRGRYGEVGVIYIDTSLPSRQWLDGNAAMRLSPEHLKLMMAIGHQAALAIEDTSYYQGMLQAERLATVGQTIATISHHVKNILQGIRGGSFLVHEGVKRKQWESVESGWKIVQRNQERIEALVLDMLTLSKPRTPNWQRHDIRETVADCVQLVEHAVREAGIQLIWHPPEEPLEAACEPEALHRAVLNILLNAVDALQGQPEPQLEVCIGRRETDGWFEIAIRDTGPGISEDDVQRLFSLFESTKGSRGTGLGLPVSRKIMQEHRGDVLIESRLGEGTCFRLVWPPSDVDAA
jgi:two-component system NtrC family sensor kinase